jgi:DNA-directed RNA polymerase II subunit RPB2
MMTKSGDSIKRSAIDQRIVAIIPYVKEEIPIIIVFRALGFVADRDILECIIYDIHDLEMINLKTNRRLWISRRWQESKFQRILFQTFR